jgi:hypothetical protein
VDAYKARTHLTKIAFTELRAACVSYGGRLTGRFLELETKIDNRANYLHSNAVVEMQRANAVIVETDQEGA